MENVLYMTYFIKNLYRSGHWKSEDAQAARASADNDQKFSPMVILLWVLHDDVPFLNPL